MKTLTEFSTLTLRKAAEARAKVRRSAPAPAVDNSAAPVPAQDAVTAPVNAEEPAQVEAAPVETDSATPAPSEATESAEASATPAAAPDPAIDAVAAELGVQPDRAARLLEALDIIGDRIDQVRLVRVFQGDTKPTGAVSRGEFHYAIDRVAAPSRARRDDRKRDDRGGRGGGGGGGGGGRGGGMGGPGGGRDKPRGLGSLKAGAKEAPKDDDERGPRGEMPRAGIGWQLTAAPREFRGGPREGRGGPRRGPGGPGGDRRDRRGPGGGGPGGPRGDGPRGPRSDSRGPRGPRPEGGGFAGPRQEGAGFGGARRDANGGGGHDPRPPAMGPDGQPLPPRSKRPRKEFGPDANGLGPDGKPWDPTRREKRIAEREAQRPAVNAAGSGSVEPTPPSADATPPDHSSSNT